VARARSAAGHRLSPPDQLAIFRAAMTFLGQLIEFGRDFAVKEVSSSRRAFSQGSPSDPRVEKIGGPR